MFDGRPETYGFPYRFDPRTPEITRSRQAVLSEMLSRFRREPISNAGWYLLGKPAALWSWDIVQGQGDVFVFPVSRSPYGVQPVFVWSHRLMKWLHLPLIALGMFGSILAWLPMVAGRMAPVSRAAVRLVSLLLIYTTVLHMLGAPFPRYSVPFRPLIYGMAMFALSLLPEAAGGLHRYFTKKVEISGS
jgi:hypothetical protein